MFNINQSTKINNRINNKNNENIVAIWNSKIPQSSFFLTIFNSNWSRMKTAEDIFNLFPDTSIAVIGYCLQQCYHIHILITLLNEYSSDKILETFYNYFSSDLTSGDDLLNIKICPVYKSIISCYRYIDRQVIIEDDVKYLSVKSLIAEDELYRMNFIGNTWWRVLLGDDNYGVSYKMLYNWCRSGYPPYAYTHRSIRSRHMANQGFIDFYKNLEYFDMSRNYYHPEVECKLIKLDESSNVYNELHNYLVELFGESRAALPFVYNLRGCLCSFMNTAFPNYNCQPAIILYCSDDFINIRAQNETIRSILYRLNHFANVECLAIICKNPPEFDDFIKEFSSYYNKDSQ